jgi:hypothetical protein
LIPALVLGSLFLGFVVFALLKGNLNMGYFIGHQLFIDTDKTAIVQHIFFQGLIQLIFIVLIIFLLIKWKNKKYAVAILIFIGCLDMALAARLNGAYTVYSHNFKSKDIYEHSTTFPDGFPVPDNGPVLKNRDTKGLAYKSLWRNLNIFHKQVSWEGYNPLHLKGFEELADNHPKLFETILQNPLVYLSDNVSPRDSLARHEADSNYVKGRIYFDKEEYGRLSIVDCRLWKGDTVFINSFSPVEVNVTSQTKDTVLLNMLQNNYYGWKATVDGQEVKVYTGNMSFLAVLLLAGEHEVVFYYDPQAVKVGFWISLIALFAGLFMLAFYYYKRKIFKPLRH